MRIGHLQRDQASVWLGIVFAAFSLMQFLCAPIAGRPQRPVRAPPGAAGLAGGAGRERAALGRGCRTCGGCWGCASSPARWPATSPRPRPTSPTSRRRSAGRARSGWWAPCSGSASWPARRWAAWLGSVWMRLPFLVAAVLIGAQRALRLLVLPESLPPERRRASPGRAPTRSARCRLFSASGDLPARARLVLRLAGDRARSRAASSWPTRCGSAGPSPERAGTGAGRHRPGAGAGRAGRDRRPAGIGARRTALVGYGFAIARLRRLRRGRDARRS